jgi:8-oxo-dGTP diphosphatase
VVDRFRAGAAVYGVLVRRGRVLLMRRAGSGYRDGQLGLPSGHLDGDEDAVSGLIRELREEIAVDVPPEACRLSIVLHRRAETPRDPEYVDLVFSVESWSGTPSIGEPRKCTELVWAPLDRLPSDTIDYVGAALRGIRDGLPLLTIGWPAPVGPM